MIKPSLLDNSENLQPDISDEELDKVIKQQKVLLQLRKSQIKFNATTLTLDVCQSSTFIQGYLNRQIIVLMHCLGVSKDYFI